MAGYHEPGDDKPALMLYGMAVPGRAWPPAMLNRQVLAASASRNIEAGDLPAFPPSRKRDPRR